MSYTPVHNRFWSDGWIRQLNALDRYLFLYLLTNGRAQLTGIYELPLDMMAAESGIDERDLRMSMLQRLEPKVYYREGWVIMLNYPKHRVGGGHKYNQGVRANFEELPPKIREIAKELGYPMDTLSIDYSHFPIRIDKNRIDTSVADAPQIVSLLGEKREARTAKYPHKKEVSSWFPHPEPSWLINATECKHMELLYERGEKKVKSALAYVAKHKDDDFFPKVNKPSDLERKWNDIVDYADKQERV